MLLDVITQLSADTGLDLEQRRTTLLNLANRASRELWKQLETTTIYREVTLAVPPNAVVSLPSFIGPLKGMRMHTNELPFDLNSIGQPRYVSTTLSFKFKNWRDLGFSPVQKNMASSGKLKLKPKAVESTPVTVTVLGETEDSAEIEEEVIVNNIEVLTENNFVTIKNISCFTARNYDIYIEDPNANVIAVLYNNQKTTKYKIVDVSQVFWTIDTNDGSSLIDVLYKLPCDELTRDTDSFYAGDEFDEAWYNMAMFFFLKPIENRATDAQAAYNVATGFIKTAKESNENGIVKKLQFGRNKFFGIFRKYRYFPGSVTNVDNNIQT